MKRFVALSLAFAFAVAFAALYAAEAKETTFHGVITDDMCGKKHMGGDDKACALKCVEKGAKFALYDPTSDKVFALSDQTKAKGFAAEHVTVTEEVERAKLARVVEVARQVWGSA